MLFKRCNDVGDYGDDGIISHCKDNAIAGHLQVLPTKCHNPSARNDVKTNRKNATAFKFCRLGFLPQQYLPANNSRHVAMPNWQRLVAFTLAEVLITLGIIGIVAAMTLPTVIVNYQKQEMVSKLKKSYSVINQALKLSEVKNGEYLNWDTDLSPINYLEKYWLSYFNVDAICSTYSRCGYKSNVPWSRFNRTDAYSIFMDVTLRVPFTTFDGTLYSISVNGGTEEAKSMILIDINGAKGPNRVGRDFFMFTRVPGGSIRPFGYDKTDEELAKDCSVAGDCNYCAAKLVRDDWKVLKGYPF